MIEGPGHPEILRIVAPNPGPMTLEGTNTYLFGSDPCTVIDPGPDIESHLDAVRATAEERGGLGTVLLTHGHGDHADGAGQLGVEVILPVDGEEHGGLRAIATPGHAPDHVCLITADRVCFSGDLVLGAGSTFVPPDGGSLAAYMDSLRRMQAEPIELICPGHGPWIEDPATKLAEYVEHRAMRERRLLAALERGERSHDALLAAAWADVPAELRPAAEMVMQAHLDKLAAEGRLPPTFLLDAILAAWPVRLRDEWSPGSANGLVGRCGGDRDRCRRDRGRLALAGAAPTAQAEGHDRARRA